MTYKQKFTRISSSFYQTMIKETPSILIFSAPWYQYAMFQPLSAYGVYISLLVYSYVTLKLAVCIQTFYHFLLTCKSTIFKGFSHLSKHFSKDIKDEKWYWQLDFGSNLNIVFLFLSSGGPIYYLTFKW